MKNISESNSAPGENLSIGRCDVSDILIKDNHQRVYLGLMIKGK
jgi:hypothetical protein